MGPGTVAGGLLPQGAVKRGPDRAGAASPALRVVPEGSPTTRVGPPVGSVLRPPRQKPLVRLTLSS